MGPGMEVFHGWNARASTDLARDNSQMKSTTKSGIQPRYLHPNEGLKLHTLFLCAHTVKIHTINSRARNLVMAQLNFDYSGSPTSVILAKNSDPRQPGDLALPGPSLLLPTIDCLI
ncbi:hypothetical protein V6Z96_000371 [Aspergillus fumigatus]